MTDEQLRSAVAHLASAIVILANRTIHEIGLDSAKAVAAECAAAVEALHNDGPDLCFVLTEDNGSFCGRTLPCPEHNDGEEGADDGPR